MHLMDVALNSFVECTRPQSGGELETIFIVIGRSSQVFLPESGAAPRSSILLTCVGHSRQAFEQTSGAAPKSDWVIGPS